jgi:hypothetical protein
MWYHSSEPPTASGIFDSCFLASGIFAMSYFPYPLNEEREHDSHAVVPIDKKNKTKQKNKSERPG